MPLNLPTEQAYRNYIDAIKTDSTTNNPRTAFIVDKDGQIAEVIVYDHDEQWLYAIRANGVRMKIKWGDAYKDRASAENRKAS